MRSRVYTCGGGQQGISPHLYAHALKWTVNSARKCVCVCVKSSGRDSARGGGGDVRGEYLHIAKSIVFPSFNDPSSRMLRCPLLSRSICQG